MPHAQGFTAMHAPTRKTSFSQQMPQWVMGGYQHLCHSILEHTAVTGPFFPTPPSILAPARPQARLRPPSSVNQGLTVQNTTVPQPTGMRLRDPGPAWDQFLCNCTSGPSKDTGWGTPRGKGGGDSSGLLPDRLKPAPLRLLLDSTRDQSIARLAGSTLTRQGALG